ncbi:MAG: hypothetical protein RBR82_12075 [Pseudomonas sp.]|nr:hypothetical protein [Pseudomonas sp.]
MISFFNNTKKTIESKKQTKNRDFVRKLVAWDQRQMWCTEELYSSPLILAVREVNDNIYSVAVIDVLGHTKLDSLINPGVQFSDEAYEIYGITKKQLDDAPTWTDFSPKLLKILDGRKVIIYAAAYILDLLTKHELLSFTSSDLTKNKTTHNIQTSVFYMNLQFKLDNSVFCAANLYAKSQDRAEVFSKTKKPEHLLSCAVKCGVSPTRYGRSALTDCVLTLRILERIAAE